MTQWTVERLGRKGDGVALAGDARALAALTLPGEVIEGEVIRSEVDGMPEEAGAAGTRKFIQAAR